MDKIILREYQKRAVEKILWALELDGNDLAVLATASGKSIIIAEVANRIGKDVLILQPSIELLEQNMEKLSRYVPRHEIGVYSASMSSKTIRKYTFATIGSIFRKPAIFDHIGLILIDESDVVDFKNSGGMYSKFFATINKNRLAEGLPPVKVVGFTATPYRNVLGYHKQSNGDLDCSTTLKLIMRMKPFFWKRVLVNVNYADLLGQGYLSPIKYESETFLTHEQMQTNKSRSDFDLPDFERKLGNRQQQVVEKVAECQRRFKSVLVFCSSVSQARTLSAAVPGSAYVTADTPKDERAEIIRGFKNFRIQTVFNVSCLTVGFDHPELDCIMLLRPTRSIRLYMQMIGRGTRIAEGKSCCTVIDWTNTVENIGPIDSVKLVREAQWELYAGGTDFDHRWHGRQLYSWVSSKQSKSVHIHRAIAKKQNAGGRLF